MNFESDYDTNSSSAVKPTAAIVELEAMQVIAASVADLDEGARRRVLRWVQDYFNIDSPSNEDQHFDTREVPTEYSRASNYETFGELYSAVDPITQEDKALTAAYWLQVIQGRESWQSADVQKELRELGYALSNVADSVSSAVQKRPQRVIQLKKSGSSRQARKTFKLSDAGKKYIEDKLTSGDIGQKVCPDC